jgi:hypothetical protein
MCIFINRGGHKIQLSWLMSMINGGRAFFYFLRRSFLPVSRNRFMEADILKYPSPKMTNFQRQSSKETHLRKLIFGSGHATRLASKKTEAPKALVRPNSCSSINTETKAFLFTFLSHVT